MAQVEYKLEEGTPQKKSQMVWLVAILAVVVLVAGGTLAYLTTTTDTASNVFTAGNIEAELIEDAWDPTAAENMLPGTTVDKDPLIKNTTSFETDEWTGMVVKFQKPETLDTDGTPLTWENMSDAEVTALLTGVRVQSGNDAITVGGFAPHANWGARIDTGASVDAIIPGQWVYAYNAVIAKDASTVAIIDEVGIIPTAGNEEWDGDIDTVDAANFMTWLYTPLTEGGCEGHFQIEVQGAAVQGDVTADEAKRAILRLFGYTVTP